MVDFVRCDHVRLHYIKAGGISMPISIKKIKLHHLNMTLNDSFTTSFGSVQNKDFYIVEAIDNAGNHGFGESVAFSVPWYTEETFQTTFHVMTDVLTPLLKQYEV